MPEADAGEESAPLASAAAPPKEAPFAGMAAAAAAAATPADELPSTGGSSQWVVAALSVVLSAVAVTFIFGGFDLSNLTGGGYAGGAGAEFEQEVLPEADARATIKFKMNIDEVWEYVALPNTWPLWQAGWDQVSGEIDTVAEAGNRVRAHLAGPAGHGANREIQWTIMQIREPKYSMDGDGMLWAVGKDVKQAAWSMDLRIMLKPLRRGKMTNVTQVLYWTGSLGGDVATPSMKKQWTQYLKKSSDLLSIQLQEPTMLETDPEPEDNPLNDE